MGGPTPVINASLAGVLVALEKHGFEGRTYMPEGGVKGFVSGAYNVLSEPVSKVFSHAELERFKRTPSSDTIASRDKANDEKCGIIHEECRKLDIHSLFLIGGNDTAENARIIQRFAQEAGYELAVLHIPKTIDCDLKENDHTPGFPSAATFLVDSVARLDYERRGMNELNMVVVMGRDASYLALSTALANRGDLLKGPHLIYPAEVIFEPDRFVEDVLTEVARIRSQAGLNSLQVVFSEGIRIGETDARGKHPLYYEKLADEYGLKVERDSFGNVRMNDLLLAEGLVRMAKHRLGKQFSRYTGNAPNYLPRCAKATELDVREAFEAGEQAVMHASNGAMSGSIALVRNSYSAHTDYGGRYTYGIDYRLVGLEDVAKIAKSVPRGWINEAGNYPSYAFMHWVEPLVDMGLGLNGISLPRKMVSTREI